MLTPEHILSLTQPEQLFAKDTIKEEYYALAKAWHPDVNKSSLASDVFAHIKMLYDKGVEILGRGAWHIPGLLTLTSLTGSSYNLKYNYHTTFELGETYIGNSFIAYLIKKEYADLYNNYLIQIGKFKYPTEKMEEEFKRCLPMRKTQFETNEYFVMVLAKTKEVIPLRLALKYFNGKLHPRDVGWIMSNMYNMLCFLEYNNIGHNDINLDTYFISPQHHSGLLLGGWWYSQPIGTTLRSVPVRTFNLLTQQQKDKKIAVKEIDNRLCKATCLELLGEKAMLDPEIPKSLLYALKTPDSDNAIKNYAHWRKTTLISIFGEIKFHKMEIDYNKLY